MTSYFSFTILTKKVDKVLTGYAVSVLAHFILYTDSSETMDASVEYATEEGGP